MNGRFAIAGDRAPTLSFSEDGTGTITVEAAGGRPAYLQIGAESGQSQLVALPVAYGPQSTCRVHVRSGDRGIAATVRLTDPELDAVGGYLSSGRADRALNALSGLAQELLYGKITSPLGAALGGYTLLRLHALDRMHNWPRNLANGSTGCPTAP